MHNASSKMPSTPKDRTFFFFPGGIGAQKFRIDFWLISDFVDIFRQGITNTVGAVPGIVGVALTGYLLDLTHSWSVSFSLDLFLVARCIYMCYI